MSFNPTDFTTTPNKILSSWNIKYFNSVNLKVHGVKKHLTHNEEFDLLVLDSNRVVVFRAIDDLIIINYGFNGLSPKEIKQKFLDGFNFESFSNDNMVLAASIKPVLECIRDLAGLEYKEVA